MNVGFCFRERERRREKMPLFRVKAIYWICPLYNWCKFICIHFQQQYWFIVIVCSHDKLTSKPVVAVVFLSYLRHFFANIFPLWLTKFNLDFVHFHITNNINPNLQTNNWMKTKNACVAYFPFVWFGLVLFIRQLQCVWLWLSLWWYE